MVVEQQLPVVVDTSLPMFLRIGPKRNNYNYTKMAGDGPVAYVCERPANGWNQGPDKVLYLYHAQSRGQWCAVHAQRNLTKDEFLQLLKLTMSPRHSDHRGMSTAGWWAWDYFDADNAVWTELGEFETALL